MTVDELDKIKTAKTKSKYKSRTFWLTILWTSFVPLSIVVQVFLKEIEIPIESLVTLAGSITLLFIGGNKGENIATTMKLKKE